MRIAYLKKDFYDKIYDLISPIESNISNQYLDRITEGKVQFPYITLKTSIGNENIGTQMIHNRSGDIRVIVYHTEYEAMCNIVSQITTALETGDSEFRLGEYDEDDDMLEYDGKRPYYTAIDIKVSLYPNGL